ncbi:MAG TPA: hypothetical protein DHU96_13080 [Actinobacteria bacterium]|nr:hypothetical protein [Actinomycetota bacterium]
MWLNDKDLSVISQKPGVSLAVPDCGAVLAAGAALGARLAFPLDRAATLVAGMVDSAPAPQLQALLNAVAASRVQLR